MEPVPRRILLADHGTERLPDLKAELEEAGHVLVRTHDAVATLEAIAGRRPDIVVLAPLSSSPESPEIARIVEAKDRMQQTPLLLVLPAPPGSEEWPLLAAVADDVLVRGPDLREVLRDRILLALGRLARLRRIEEEKLALERQSITDFKTGTYNDRYFHRRLREEFERARRHRQAISCVMLDFDNFKEINDTFDHVFGDFVLLAFAKKVRSVIRSIDIAARVGGDEFVVLLPNTGLDEAVVIADRIRRIVSDYAFECDGRSTRVSLSVGIASYDGFEDTGPEELLRRADRCLLEAKRRGRSRMVLYPQIAGQRPAAGGRGGEGEDGVEAGA